MLIYLNFYPRGLYKFYRIYRLQSNAIRLRVQNSKWNLTYLFHRFVLIAVLIFQNFYQWQLPKSGLLISTIESIDCNQTQSNVEVRNSKVQSRFLVSSILCTTHLNSPSNLTKLCANRNFIDHSQTQSNFRTRTFSNLVFLLHQFSAPRTLIALLI